MIKIKRVYDPADPTDGQRFLVDRLWPRGVKKEALELADWLKDLAPSDELRHWFGHDPSRWEEFCGRYQAELAGQEVAWRALLEAGRTQVITLLFAAHDEEHNNAVALRMFLEEQLAGGKSQTHVL